MRKKKMQRVRDQLGFFENYVEHCGQSNRPLDTILGVLGMIIVIAVGASAYAWLAG